MSPVHERFPAPISDVRLFDERDRGWIAALLALVVTYVRQPWRVLLERIEQADLEVHPSRLATVVRALRRLSGGRSERARVARTLRELVLGPPALETDERAARLAIAAARLGLPACEIEPLLWADLALERPVVLPAGPPRIESLIAHANLDRIQRAVRRARCVRLAVTGPANELVRTIARFGLIAKLRAVEGELRFEITGPLALFHATTVYGRALAQLVPLLAEQAGFELVLECELEGAARTLVVTPPVALPVIPPSRARPREGARLARALERAGLAVECTPSPIAIGEDVLVPELVVTLAASRIALELVGFSTLEHLAHKLGRYAAAGVPVVLCVDRERSPELVEDPRVVPFTKHVDAAALVRHLAGLAR